MFLVTVHTEILVRSVPVYLGTLLHTCLGLISQLLLLLVLHCLRGELLH